MKRVLFIVLTCAVLASCAGYKSRKEAKKGYATASEQLNELVSCMESLNTNSSISDIQDAKCAAEALSYDYNPVGLDSVTVAQCSQLKKQVGECKAEALSDIECLAKEKKISIVSDDDLLVEGITLYAASLKKGDVFHYSLKAKAPSKGRYVSLQRKGQVSRFPASNQCRQQDYRADNLRKDCHGRGNASGTLCSVLFRVESERSEIRRHKPVLFTGGRFET
mgnify:CR=1 FL=1